MASDPRLVSVREGRLVKLPLLLADLQSLEADKTPAINPAAQGALHMAAQIVCASAIPLRLLGYLYVLARSLNGGISLKSLFAESLGVLPQTLSYFRHAGSTTC